MRALVRRINRRLPTVVGENPDTQTPIVGVNRKVLTGCRLSAVRSSKQRMKFGGFVLVNHDSYADDSGPAVEKDHVDPEKLGRELGVLKPWEVLADK